MKKIFLSMLALSLTYGSFAQAQNKDESKGKKEWRHKGGNDLQEKLNLSDAQKSQMKTLNESFRGKMQDLKQDKTLSEDARKQKRMDLMKEQQTQVQSLLTPEQKKQWEESKKEMGSRGKKGERMNGGERGGKMADRKEKTEQMAKDLNLSPDQSARFKQTNESFKSGVQSIRSNDALTSDQKKEQMKSLHKKHQDDINSILNDGQKAKYKESFKNRKGKGASKITK